MQKSSRNIHGQFSSWVDLYLQVSLLMMRRIIVFTTLRSSNSTRTFHVYWCCPLLRACVLSLGIMRRLPSSPHLHCFLCRSLKWVSIVLAHYFHQLNVTILCMNDFAADILDFTWTHKNEETNDSIKLYNIIALQHVYDLVTGQN